jgi:Spy/CpxP family protein refolding chaperone
LKIAQESNMSSSWFRRTFIAMAATTACAVSIGGPLAVVSASSGIADTPEATATAPAMHHWRGARHHRADPLLAAVQQLNLSADQQTGIHGLISSARQAQRAQAKAASDYLFITLGNPGDAGYNAAVATAKSRAVERIQARSSLDGQIYALLSPEQQAQLPQVLAAMQAKLQSRRVNSRANG